MGDQRLPGRPRGAVRVRRPDRRHRRAPADGPDRDLDLRRGVGALRRDAGRRDRRALADLLAGRSGRRRGDHVPGCPGDRRRRLPARRARARDGRLLRHRRRADRDRPARRRLPDRADLAVDLLDQRSGRDRGGDPDPAREAGRHAPAGPARLQGRRPRRVRARAARPRPPAVERLGLGQRRDLGLDRPRADPDRRLHPRRARHRVAADAAPHLREQGVRGRQRRPLPDLDRVRADVPVREHVFADLARLRPQQRRPLHRHLLRRLRDRRPVGRTDARPRRRPGAGRARLRDRGGRLLPLGPLDARHRLRRGLEPVVADHDRRRRDRSRPRPGDDRCPQPRPAHELRRGDRDHADDAQRRRQRRPRDPRHPADLREPLEHRVPLRGPRREQGPGRRRRRLAQPVRRRRRLEPDRAGRLEGRGVLPRRPGRLRELDRDRLLRHGDRDGPGRDRRPRSGSRRANPPRRRSWISCTCP